MQFLYKSSDATGQSQIKPQSSMSRGCTQRFLELDHYKNTNACVTNKHIISKFKHRENCSGF